MTAITSAPPAAPSRRIALIVASAQFMQLLDGTIISTSLPQMGVSFGVAPVAMSIGITAYLLTMAVFVPLSAWLADRFGSRRIFLLSIAIFTLSSVACGLAQSLPFFVVARGVQGFAAALLVPVGRMIVLRNAAKSELVAAIALITWPALFAPVIGPILGGFITTTLSWHWNFFINLPLGILGFGFAARFIPDSREPELRPLDWRGFFLSSVGLACLLWSLERISHSEGEVAVTLALLLAGIAIGWSAVRHLRSAPQPLLDLSAFRVRTFAISILTAGTFLRIAINATPFLLPLLFQINFGMSPVEAGGFIFAYFLGNLGMKTVTTPLLRLVGFRRLLFINGLIVAGSVMACGAILPSTQKPLVIALMVVAGLSRSMQMTAVSTLSFADLKPTQRNSASTLASMLQQGSMLLGVAIPAMILNLSQMLRGGGPLDLVDFRLAFLAVGIGAFVASFRFLTLEPSAGGEVSGHQAGKPAGT